MKNTLNKQKITSTIVLILLMASIILSAGAPVRAQTYTNMRDGGSTPLPTGVTADETYETIGHVSFSPNPIGLGQNLLVNVWMQPPISALRYYKNAFQVTFTKPDGTTDVKGPLSSYQGDATAWLNYVPDQVGNWTIKFDFLGAYYPAGNYSVTAAYLYGNTINFPLSIYYKPSSDGPYTLTVQNEPVMSWPGSPLPTDYWTRPVSPENREWWPILGNYPATGIVGGGPGWPADTNIYMSNYAYIPYVQAPHTAHIVWKRQDALGGVIGGPMGQQSYVNAGATPPLIYAGRCYQTFTKMINNVPTSVWECYDLRTGQVYWDQVNVTYIPTMIRYLPRSTAIVPGETAGSEGMSVDLMYIGGGYIRLFNPWLGTSSSNISITPFTSATYYGDPSFLSIQTIGSGANTQYRLCNWSIIGDPGFPTIVNLRPGVTYNVSYPFSSIGTADYESMIDIHLTAVNSLAAGGVPLGIENVAYSQQIVATSLITGKILWNVSTNPSTGLGGTFSGSTAVADHGKFALRLNDGHWHCWNLQNGQELWTSELTSWPWGTFGCYGVQSYGGNIISNQYDGVAAYNWSTGKVSWLFQSKAPYAFETPYQDNYPWFTGTTRIADGIIFTYNTEHTPSQPATRGWKLYAINATTGQGIWNITGDMAPGGVADGYLTAGNMYDGYMYVFGKGLSSTTISGPQIAISSGQSLVLTGTVLDQSPAEQGKACVSAQSMPTYMEYLHMGLPIDGVGHNITVIGVPVSLDTLDPNGNYQHIATVTSDASGAYGYTWTPTTTGQYEVTATFAGDNSYGSSWASTYVAVTTAPTTSPTATTVPITVDAITNSMMSLIIGGVIAIIIAIAIVGIVLYKKH